MSIDSYAQYSVAMAFQAVAISLTNVGLTESIVPLVGKNVSDKNLIGRYIRATLHLRNRIFYILSPMLVGAYLATTSGHGWSLQSQIAVIVSIFAALYLSVTNSSYSVPLVVNRRLRDYYTGQVYASALRFVACALAFGIGLLGAAVAAMTSALAIAVGSTYIRRKASALVTLPPKSDPDSISDVLRCSMPTMPAAIFSSFQPQLALLLISIVGQATQIAQVGALSRLAQLFLVFSAFNSMVIEPYVARVSNERLIATVLRIITGALLIGIVIAATAYMFPEIFVNIIGKQYEEMRPVVFWAILASTISSFANVLWVICRARRWLFWRGSAIEISLLVLLQAAYVVVIGVDSTATAAKFMLAASAAHLLTHAYVLCYGFLRSRRLAG